MSDHCPASSTPSLLHHSHQLFQSGRAQHHQRRRKHVEDSLFLDRLADALSDLKHRLADIENLEAFTALLRETLHLTEYVRSLCSAHARDNCPHGITPSQAASSFRRNSSLTRP